MDNGPDRCLPLSRLIPDELLVLRAQAGDMRAAELLSRRYHKLIFSLAAGADYIPIDREDRQSWALLGFLRACETYQQGRSKSFASWAFTCIRQALAGAYQSTQTLAHSRDRNATSLDAPMQLDDGEASLLDCLSDPASRDPLAALIDGFDREAERDRAERFLRQVAVHRNGGLDGARVAALLADGLTPAEIGAQIGATGRRVSLLTRQARLTFATAERRQERRVIGSNQVRTRRIG